MNLGATYLGEGRCRFVVWAPLADTVEVRFLETGDPFANPWSAAAHRSKAGRLVKLEPLERGYHQGIVADVEPGAHYMYLLNGEKERPDPASRFQPAGVHGPSQVRDARDFEWRDEAWAGLGLEDYFLYEIHTGTYSPEGTFEGVIPHLNGIKELGVTAIELMPVAQFPGDRNWGYDGVYPFAVQNSYGGPHGLKTLVDACHRAGLAVVLDVVYNHLGPEGNYLNDFAPYFTAQYRGPWGQAINFDGPHSDEVVRFFTENALYWLNEFHIDALRLDAIHGIVDRSARPFLQLLAESVHEFAANSGRKIFLIAESDFNDVRYIQPPELGGCGLDAQWNDDFHHALHTLLTGERAGYYEDFGRLEHLEKAFREGFVYSGQYSAFRRQRHGNSSRGIPARKFVVFAQNHDQVGNRLLGDRLSSLVTLEALKLAAATVLFSPYIPLLFMGEEYGETAPFQYFTSHSDNDLIEAVRRGRREEFAAFKWQAEPPDPQDAATFRRSKLDHKLRYREPHRTLLEFVREAVRLRRILPCLAELAKEKIEIQRFDEQKILQVRRWNAGSEALLLANFDHEPQCVRFPLGGRSWRKALDSAAARWRGPGSCVPGNFAPAPGQPPEAVVNLHPQSCCILEREI